MNVRRGLLAVSAGFSLVACALAVASPGAQWGRLNCGPLAGIASVAACTACCATAPLPAAEILNCQTYCAGTNFTLLPDCPWYNPYCW